MWFIGVEVEQETRAPPPKKNPGSAPDYGSLIYFLALLPRSFVLVRCLREANVAIFCGRFSWSRQTSLSKGFFYYFHDSTTELYFRSATRQCRCYFKTKTTKYCLKHEGKSHPCHPRQN